MLREIGGAGQAKLAGATAVVVGAGGLGGPAGLYLAAAGVGHIRVVDFDRVETTNLQRQVQFAEADVGQSKAETLAARLRALDGALEVEAVDARLDASNAESLLAGADVVLDGTDNFGVRFAVDAASRALEVPLVSGACAGWGAQVGVFNRSPDAPCYRCLVPEAPPDAATCEAVGIVGAVAGLAGSMMALEAVKLLVGEGVGRDAGAGVSGPVPRPGSRSAAPEEELAAGPAAQTRLWVWDGLRGEGRTLRVPRDPACRYCQSPPRSRPQSPG